MVFTSGPAYVHIFLTLAERTRPTFHRRTSSAKPTSKNETVLMQTEARFKKECSSPGAAVASVAISKSERLPNTNHRTLHDQTNRSVRPRAQTSSRPTAQQTLCRRGTHQTLHKKNCQRPMHASRRLPTETSQNQSTQFHCESQSSFH